MKCGTSALHYYLDLHPDIAMSTPKELDFFVDDEIVESGDCIFEPEDRAIEDTLERNWSRGLGWYADHFSADAPVRGESSPSYTSPWYPGVAERMASVVPEAKLVFIVGDPVERTISNYVHQWSIGRERRSPDQALSSLTSPYVARSRYGRAVEPYIDRFSRSRLLVITQEELRRRRRETVQAVYRFAGVDDSFWSPKVERERYGGSAAAGRRQLLRRLEGTPMMSVARRLPDEAKWWIDRALSTRSSPDPPTIDPSLRERLASHFRDDVARLASLTGRAFPEWPQGPDSRV